jgi:cobalt-zinc-cadmium efflux system membrane fusion protein
VWLVADVPEQSAGNLSIGKTVHAEVPALPGHKLVGKITFVSATVNPETRTVTTRMNVPNSNRRLKPSMLTTMTLVDGTERRLVIPADAVVRDGNSDSVFVRANQNTFVLKAVKLADEIAGLRVVEEGLTEDDRIVTKGAFHLNNERRRLALGGEEGS